MNKKYFQITTKNIQIVVFLVLSLFMNMQVKAQGVDVIFWLDNSASINATEWTNMSNSVRSIMADVLGCNPNNRAAVVHYGNRTAIKDGEIYIESNFTNNYSYVSGFSKRLSGGDDAYQALGSIGNALDGIADSKISSTQKILTRNSNNKLVIFLFTDAFRYYNVAPAYGALVANGTIGSSTAFTNYNNFKTNRGATFVVIHAPTGGGATIDTPARAAAAIASVGGSYNGAVEANSGDPEGSQTKPRKAIMSDTFNVSTLNIETLADNICKSCAPIVSIDAVTPPTQEVCLNGTPQALVADATGTGTLSYQWFRNNTNSTTGGTLIAGATSVSYTPPANTAGTTYYYVVVEDDYCEGKATSTTVSVTVNSTPCVPTCEANAGTLTKQ